MKKKKLIIPFLAVVGVFSSLCGCQENDDLDIENGWDNNKHPESDVEVDTLAGIDVSMYHLARIFPGLVDTLTEKHIEKELHLDLSKPFVTRREYGFSTRFVDKLAANALPQPIYSTGLYAGAGELVKIVIPESDVFGLTVQIGIHTDDLSSVASYFREPIAFTRKTLHSGTNYVRFPLGGYIWIIREPNAIGKKDIELNFSGVYEAPDYVLNETDPAEWQSKIMATTVPWAELRGRHLAISIDVQRLQKEISENPAFAQQLDDLLSRWDKFMELYWLSKGISPEADKNSDRMPYFPERVVFDAQLLKNLACHIDNIQAVMMLRTSQFYKEMASLSNIKSTDMMTFFNALNSKYQLASIDLKWLKAMNYLPVYRNAEQNYLSGDCGKVAGCEMELDKYLLPAYSFAAADSAKSLSNAMYQESRVPEDVLRLALLSQLGKYDVLRDKSEYSSINSLLADFRRGNIMSTAESSMFRMFCDRYRENLTPLYDNWGISLADADREYATKYKLPDRQIWKIKPVDKNNAFAHATAFDKSKFRYRHNRNLWEAYATDATYENNNEDTEYTDERYSHLVQHLFDGDKSTYWASYLGKNDNKLGGQPSKLELPYYIVIDMKEAKRIDGLYFVNGSRKYVSKFIVQTTSSSNINLEDAGVQWHNIATLKQTFASPYNEQFLELSHTVTTRYLRIVITELNLNQTVFATWDDEDKEKAKNLNSLRYQQFAEFGTFYYKK